MKSIEQISHEKFTTRERTCTSNEWLRYRIKKYIHLILSSKPCEECQDTAALIVLYNWARGFPAMRGFTPLKRNSANAGEHPSQTFIRLTSSSSRLKKVFSYVLREETLENQKNAEKDFRTWRMAAGRALLVKQFTSLPERSPGLKSLLRRISILTPHGASDACVHGRDARAYFHAILYEFRKRIDPHAHRPSAREGVRSLHSDHLQLPLWAQNVKNIEFLVQSIKSFTGQEINTYLEMHDCGKAFCLTTDDQGRNHYPDHSRMSASAWKKAGGTLLECELMEKDMLIHTVSAAACEDLSQDPLTPILLIAALTEIHANAIPIFNGFESDSFKIKLKQIERRGSALFRKWVL